MSKPRSGHFSGTTGSKNASKKLSRNNDRGIIIIPNGLDLREHPTKYKQLSSKKRTALRKKVQLRTITKAEYKRLDWQNRLDTRRKAGIDSFWDRERYLISLRLPTTRNWSEEQSTDISEHKTPKFNGKPMQSHHTYSVAKYPHLANQGSLIYPVTAYEHTNRWHYKGTKNSLPGRPNNYNAKEQF